MACELTLSGNIVIGGSGCGCSGGSSGGATKMQPLSFGCPARQFGAIASTDCPVRINALGEWVALPGVPDEVDLLFLQTSAAMDVRWGGAVAELTGNSVLGGIVLGVDEQFSFDTSGFDIVTDLDAGTYTLAQVVERINAAAMLAGAGYMPAALTPNGTQIVLRAKSVDAAPNGVFITSALSAIGFPDLDEVEGEAPTVVSVNGLLLQQFSAPVSGLQVRGVGSVTVLGASVSA